MSDLRRLLDDDASDDERALLEAALSDRPADGTGKARALAALQNPAAAPPSEVLKAASGATQGLSPLAWLGAGISVVAVSTGVWLAEAPPAKTPINTPATAQTRAPESEPSAAPSPGGAERAALPLASPLMSAAAKAPSVATAMSAPATQREPPHGRSAAARSSVESRTPPSAESSAEPTRASAPPSSSGTEVPATTASSAPAAPPSSATIRDEVLLLEEARAALAAGNATTAFAKLDEHARRFPRGLLGSEALVLRIRALQARGDHAAARSLARSFLEAYPASPFVERIRGLFPPHSL